MKKKQLILGVILAFIFLISSCSTNEGQKLTGQVVNAENLPVKDAGIVISYYSESINEYPKNSSTINLKYPVPYVSNVKIWVTHHNEEDTVKFLLDKGGQMMGFHTVTWNTKNEQGIFVVNGIYDFHIEYSGGSMEKTIAVQTVVLRDEYADGRYNFTKYEYLTFTDENGNFSINTNTLPLFNNFEIIYVYDKLIGTFHLSNKVRIWALHSDYSPTNEDMVLIHKDKPTEVFLKFRK